MAALRYNRGPGGANRPSLIENGRGQRKRGRGFKNFARVLLIRTPFIES